MKPEFDLSLYLVTDHSLMSTPTLDQTVEQAIDGGVTLVQLREKDASSLGFYHTALGLKRLADAKGIPLIINDRVDIALAVDAAGVHIGQEDLPARTVRAILGEDKLLGVSASTLKQAVQAERDGADYLGVGAMFATATKTDAQIVSMEELKKIRAAVSLPIVVIGGIHADTIPLFQGSGIDGFAVVSAIVAAKDISSAARGLKSLVGQQVYLKGK